MTQPEGYEEGGKGKICKLRKSIYGLKQSGRCWNKRLDEVMQGRGLKQSQEDPCIYFVRTKENFLYIGVHVDDLVTVASSPDMEEKYLSKIRREIELVTLGEAEFILGMQVIQENDGIRVHQRNYIREILKRYGMDNCNPVKVPSDVNQKLDNDEDSKEVNQTEYQELLRRLMYLAVHTRPDISYTLGALSQYNNGPKEIHMNALKRVMRYLKGTENYMLKYEKGQSNIHAYTDASWDKTKDARSFSGYVIKDGSSVIHWRSKKQETVAMSTTESELNAMSEGVKELKWMMDLAEELEQRKEKKKATLFCDSANAINIVKNKNQKSRTKYLNRKVCHVREAIKDERIEIQHIAGKEMEADFLTKGLGGPEMKRNTDKLLRDGEQNNEEKN
uniref:Reverse transcriptase Ty1/copia-type domain-containing protein n=1 Tax=Strigamia maritima TaxID=126957 RepID=T1JBW6_STRMM